MCNRNLFLLFFLFFTTDIFCANQKRKEQIVPGGPTHYFEDSKIIFAKLDKVKSYLDNGGDINGQDYAGQTLLMYAALHNDIKLLNLLIKYNADLNLRNVDGKTALFIAVEKGHFEIVKALICAGADIFIRNNNGLSVFRLAQNQVKGYFDKIKKENASLKDKEIFAITKQSILYKIAKFIRYFCKFNNDLPAELNEVSLIVFEYLM